MKNGLFVLGGLIAAAAVILVAWVLVPERIVDPIPRFALGVLALSVAVSFFVPSVMPVLTGRHRGDDASVMASIGPYVVFGLLFMIGAAVGFVLAIIGFERLAIAVDVVVLAGAALGLLAMRGVGQVVRHAAEFSSAHSAHADWVQRVTQLVAESSDPDTRRRLERIAEAFRFAASDVHDRAYDDSGIRSALATLENAVRGHDLAAIEPACRQIEILLSQREAAFRSARSRV